MRRKIAIIFCDGAGCRKQVTGENYPQAVSKAEAKGWSCSFSHKVYGLVDYCPNCKENIRVQLKEA